MKYFVAQGEDRRLDPVSRQSLRGSFVELSDGVTHYELAGPEDGDIVLLAGGLTVPLFYWDGLAAELHARGLRTLACSAYGRGYSDRVRATYDETLFVRQLFELREKLGITRPVHLVGTSVGGLVAMRYALRHPESLATLTIAGPAGLIPKKVPTHRLFASDLLTGLVARRFGRRLLEGHLGHNVRDPQQSARLVAMVLDAYRYEGSLYAFFETLQHVPLSGRAELFRRAGELGLPTLLLWGADDNVTPIAALDTARSLLKPQECHVVDCGHMAPYERPREVAERIASFTATRTERQSP
ncbi:alpha/beta fold hydrolase [Streptomyces turgidiscabies]|uniref:Hydrolase, alpha/beta domain protein n=1 Tax=Streptomyces turgidiscabies (strain Car8) TaxID=698760 RepID=L7FD84_STRT8|nr:MULTISPECIES: alpha/beta fold hydrolase [Streptomyces]ELP69036.1 hydrolase, alpha/beta domain protein [Streptomyces turgidiscabies Car8]MDX3498240.1 alpha/beta fold hydrolase [Streptomyces turgidiscabies]GAQ75213.1 putative carboxylesterase nap [Streptomyces turgidiscabies]